LDENKATAEEDSLKNITLASKFKTLEQENMELKVQLDEANDNIIQSQRQMANNAKLAIENDLKLQTDVGQLNQALAEGKIVYEGSTKKNSNPISKNAEI